MEGHVAHPKDVDTPQAILSDADVSTSCQFDELGLLTMKQRLAPDGVVLEPGIVEADRWCQNNGAQAESATRSAVAPGIIFSVGAGKSCLTNVSSRRDPATKALRRAPSWSLLGGTGVFHLAQHSD